MKIYQVSLLLLSSAAAFAPIAPPPQAVKTNTKLNVGATWHEPHNENPFQQFVTDMLRVFDIHDDETATGTKKHYATGYSGDVGRGSTTAYKALEPKPWKAPKTASHKPNQFVSDASRVFDIHREEKKVHVNPVGYTGDVGHGSTTAYKALSPKPWKAPEKVVDKPSSPNQFVSDASRVFDIHREEKKVHVNPVGFAGDVGSTTAYDALPPKQWKP